MRTRVVIQSRLSSSRLPGKALMTVSGVPLIELVARRAARTGFEVVVATSTEPYDDLIAHHLSRIGIPVMRGPLDDVLGRFQEATRDLEPTDTVVRLTGDNPVVDAALVQELIDTMADAGHSYGRVDIAQVPEGLGVEVFSVELLRSAAAEATEAYDREHVTPWIRRNCGGELLFAPACNPGDPEAYRCTTDCLHDYDRISRLFNDAEDPVAEPWSRIVTRLKAEVDALGPQVHKLENGRGFPEAVLSASRVGQGADGSPDMEVAREVFVTALDRGVSHVYCRAADVAMVRAATLPALNRRLRHVVEINPGSGDPLAVEAAVERAFADLGQRSLAGIVVSAATSSPEVWEVLAGYRARGEVTEIGMLANNDEDLTDLPDGATLVVVPTGLIGPAGADELLQRNVIVLMPDLAPGGFGVIISAQDSNELTQQLG